MSDKRIDLSLLVPDYLYDNTRFRELLEVLEGVLSEAIVGIDDLNQLWNLWGAKPNVFAEFLARFLELFGVEIRIVHQDFIKKYLSVLKSFIERKGTYDFAKLWLSFREIGAMIEDVLEKDVLVISERGKLSCGAYIQNAKEFRDAVLRLVVDTSKILGVDVTEIVKMVPVGVLLILILLHKLQFSCLIGISEQVDSFQYGGKVLTNVGMFYELSRGSFVFLDEIVLRSRWPAVFLSYEFALPFAFRDIMLFEEGVGLG